MHGGLLIEGLVVEWLARVRFRKQLRGTPSSHSPLASSGSILPTTSGDGYAQAVGPPFVIGLARAGRRLDHAGISRSLIP